ncbi:unnamed protein product [Euphydryas editha]|uniref:RecQ-mediated genome instability protein 1 n=1 Tax=Euphydryas editha TaxID=104508 RepID=A0AAU9U3E8_EUPED|nr:unnamed protein product [Euphydryas editha]
MSFDTILNNVRNYMSQNYIFVDEDWLSGCVSHYIDERYNENEIKKMTKEQWLLNNLADVSKGCLPPNLKSLNKTVLPHQYVLQINVAEDIGTPAYQQYLKLQKVNTDNLEATTNFDEKVSSHRMLKLHMTDGVQIVTGIEYEPMRNLSLDVTPGSKVLVKGPVECRRGTLLLRENCIELLGGEVAELITEFSQASILSHKLNKEIPQATDLPTNSNVSTRDEIIPIDDIHQPINNLYEDELNFSELDAIEEEYTKNVSKRSSNDELVNPFKKLKKSDDNPICDPYYDDIEDEEYLREIEKQFDAQELDSMNNSVTRFGIASNSKDNTPSRSSVVTMPIEPFMYIKQINDTDENNRIGRVFKVKAQILKILSKLTVGKKGWRLSCTIADGTGTLDVDFSSDVISKFVGFTPQEIIKLKDTIAKNPEVKEKVDLALQKAKENFQTLYCIFEVKILESPIVTQLIPFETCHVEAQRKRLHDSGL